MDKIVEDVMDIDSCYECGTDLNDENRSLWQGLTSIDGEYISYSQCVLCHEISGRLLGSCNIKNNQFIPQKTRDECIDEINQEKLTIKILKQREIESFKTRH